MKINYDEFEEIVRDYYYLKCKNDKYVNCIPIDIKSFVFSNEYSINSQKQTEMLLEKLLGVELYETFMWFLYDCPLTSNNYMDEPNVICDGRNYYISDLNSFLTYILIEYFSPTHL
jgi:hypothetical protein